ncbi:uncharacterized protein K441DRAFT_651221 [Cenococcum geophilum 1.58]|uniref:uncharacterized protein n=1 Tax=Cenococcum geophilum 1.58 TaxID=794803 RepID=UPI00358FD08D|nr:hypothetical protein K441DRAFT_651221 [Cenococcum geophilum 1.58]
MGPPEDYIHGLSQVQFHYGSSRDVSAWSHATKSDQDHVAVLEGLALLLVFTPKGDVAATSSWRSADELKLLWAKNQPVDDNNQLRYIEELLENVKNGTGTRELLNTVIAMCREKIFHRVKKLANSFGVSQNNQRQEESNLWQFDETKEPHQKLEAALKNSGWCKNVSTVYALDRFTRVVGKVIKTSEVKYFWNILYFSWSVTSIADLNKVLEEKQVRYLSKLGDYVRIIKQMPLLLKKAGKAKITIEQVRPPVAKLVEVISGSLEVLNLRCGQIVPDGVKSIENWDQVTDVYQKAQPGHPTVGKKIVNFTQHCEITLALNMLDRRTQTNAKQKIEIGVSKACCEWCCEYLNLLDLTYSNSTILIRASHGKQPDGWMIPPNSLKSVAKNMERFIEKRVDDVIWKIKGRRRSDSNELPDFTMGELDFEASERDITENNADSDMWDV